MEKNKWIVLPLVLLLVFAVAVGCGEERDTKKESGLSWEEGGRPEGWNFEAEELGYEVGLQDGYNTFNAEVYQELPPASIAENNGGYEKKEDIAAFDHGYYDGYRTGYDTAKQDYENINPGNLWDEELDTDVPEEELNW